jgi:hypothetical protein
MSWIAVAIGGSAVVGGITANNAANAQGNAAAQNMAMAQQYQIDANKAATDAKKRQNAIADTTYDNLTGTAVDVRDAQMREAQGVLDTQTGYYAPYVESGVNANAAYDYNLGIGAKPAGYTEFSGTPGYEWNVEQTTNAIDNSAASSGALFSGATLDAIGTNVQGLADQEYDDYMAMLNGQQQLGLTAADASANATGQYGTTVQNALSGYGNAAYSAASNLGSMNYGTQADYADNVINIGGNALGYMTGASSDAGNAAAAGAVAPYNALMSGIEQGVGLYGYQQMAQPTNNNWLGAVG